MSTWHLPTNWTKTAGGDQNAAKRYRGTCKCLLARYQEDLLANGHIMQSLSYTVVEELKAQAPQLISGYIMPFNVVGPH